VECVCVCVYAMILNYVNIWQHGARVGEEGAALATARVRRKIAADRGGPGATARAE